MPRLIRTDKLREEIDKWIDTVGYCTIGKGLSYYGELMGCIEDTPTEEIVCCDKCKYWDMNGSWGTKRGEQDMYFSGDCHIHGSETLSIDYCSFGKRKESTP